MLKYTQMHRPTETYYEVLENADLKLTFEDLFKTISEIIPEDLYKNLKNKASINISAFGSAAPENINSIIKFEDIIGRTSEKNKDNVIIIDLNLHPLKKQKKETEQQEQNSTNIPKFNFIQMDMRNLALGDNSLDIVIIDYTLNFNSSKEEIGATFTEIAKSLKPGGCVIFAVTGNKFLADQNKYGELQERGSQRNAYMATMALSQTKISCFPFSVYINSAKEKGLDLIASTRKDRDGIPLLHGILQKNKLLK